MEEREKFLNYVDTEILWRAIKKLLNSKVDDAYTGLLKELTEKFNKILLDYMTLELGASKEYVNLAIEKLSNDISTTLNNYMTIAIGATKEYVDLEIARVLSEAGIKMKIVEYLPEVGEEKFLYLVPKNDEDEDDIYDEYVYIDKKWERIGSTKVNLTDYWSKETLRAMTAEEVNAILKE